MVTKSEAYFAEMGYHYDRALSAQSLPDTLYHLLQLEKRLNKFIQLLVEDEVRDTFREPR